jgi:hypothetical protein
MAASLRSKAPTIRFIKVGDIPEGRKATYLRICSTDRE